MAFEIMIMISPFAFFFYSVFNPIFHFLDSSSATRWLTTFFLPHMILPPTLFLKSVRVFGSVCFVAGSITFVSCALQVYLGKIFRWGIASRGLYRLYPPSPVYRPLNMGHRDEHTLAPVYRAGKPLRHVHPLLFPRKGRGEEDDKPVRQVL